MSESNIEWTEHTWNPIRGCSPVSPGCKHCYAERDMARKNANPKVPGCHGFAVFNERHEPHWTGRVELIPEMLDIPLRRKKPTTYFVNSMSDLFHEKLPDEAIDRVFALMALCQQHTFQVLTKRAERMHKYLSHGFQWQRVMDLCWKVSDATTPMPRHGRWPLPNVWLGVSVENQEYADKRIPHLLRTPAAVRFVSYEPALGAVDFERWTDTGLECSECEWRGVESQARDDDKEEDSGFLCPACGAVCAHLPLDERLDWLIVGGESGPGARPFDLEWARQAVAQCKAAGVACFVKQLGGLPYCAELPERGNVPNHWRLMEDPGGGAGLRHRLALQDRKGGEMSEWPRDLRVREMPKCARPGN